MKLPLRSQYHDGKYYLKAMDLWAASSDASFQRLLDMYERTSPVSVKPSFLTGFSDKSDYKIRHVAIALDQATEDNKRAALNNLNGSANESEMEIVQISHGIIEEGGMPVWVCYAELRAA